MQITKKPYEISLWEDKLTYVVGEKEFENITDVTGTITASYYKEKKLCIIGSNTMDSPVRAINSKLVEKINGENIFTFSMYSQYWDQELSKLIWNPFMQYLTNERKVKLKYDGKWYDFVIKNIEEDSSTKCFTYTCKDLFINELAKTGFELEFDNDLGNNMGTLPELAQKVLEGSDWRLTDENDIIHQYIEEPLYQLKLNTDINATCVLGKNGYEKKIQIHSGETIYIFYSCLSNRSSILGFLYDYSHKQLIDDKNVFIDYSDSNPNGLYNCYIEVTWNENHSDTNTPLGTSSFISNRRGNRLVKNQKTWFDPVLQRTVKLYDNGTICGFDDTEYVSPASVQSYVTNGSNFTSTTGWYVGKASSSDASFPDLEIAVYPEITNSDLENYDGKSYLKFKASVEGQVLMNSGIQNNRTSIDGFIKGEKYILTLSGYRNIKKSTSITTKDIDLEIYEYELQNGVYTKQKDFLFSVVLKKTEGNQYKYECTCNYSISKEELKNKKIGIFIKQKIPEESTALATLHIEKMQFYPQRFYVNEEGAKEECAPGKLIDAQIKTIYSYYEKDAFTSEEDIEYLYKGETPGSYTPYYGQTNKEAFEKVRSIIAKESNRFNLLQSLSELFESWIQFTIEHEPNGAISLDEEYRQKKWVTYKQYKGRDNSIGFKYGINLKSIRRTLDSEGLVSKIIVKDNANEFAPGGFCSISRAVENPSGENSIYSFDYYIGQGMLDFTAVNNDLYLSSGGYLGYYRKLKGLNNEAQEKAEILAELVIDIANYDSQYQTYTLSADAAAQDKIDQEIKFKDLTGVEFSKALPEYQPYHPNKHGYDKNKEEWWKDKDLAWEFYKKVDDEYVKTDEQPIYDGGNAKSHYARLKWWDNNEAKKIAAAIAKDTTIEKEHRKISDKQLELKEAAILQEDNIKKRLTEIKTEKININLTFYKKYSRFIQEGSWISEDYIDDNLYYIDALSTLYTSSRPQVRYSIEVIELSQIDEYSGFKFALGDKTFVEDREFFGWAYDGSKRLYREEVIISEVDTYLDSPEQNKIVVQNYKTQFEDLFQRIVATAQQIQFSTGEYKRAASTVKADGTIEITTLQNSLANNAIVLQNAKDQSVIIGDDGITTTNLARPAEILRIVSGGIYLTENGGETWTTGISASGINASCITTGSLNAAEVNITMGSTAAMRWDYLGISAFKRDENGIHPGTFTRFDQFGLYGLNSSEGNYDPLDGAQDWETAMTKLKQDADFGLTWDGFWLKAKGTEGYVSISSERDFEVIRKSTNEEGQEIEFPAIQIGRLNPNGDTSYYGIRISNSDGAVLETNQNGELWLKQKLSIQTNIEDNTVQIGALGIDNSYSGVGKVIDASNKFKVYEDGHVEGTNAHFSGGSTFTGTINATGGQIGGLTIEEWKDIGYSVQITSSNGIVLKNNTSTVLTATLYKGSVPCIDRVTENDNNGTPITYAIKYQWKENGINMGDKTERTIDVSLTEQDTSVVYECVITLEVQQ